VNVLPLDADGHDRVEALLPAYAAGRLVPADHAEVETHLAGCARCRAELGFDQALRSVPAEPLSADPDAGWAALRARIATPAAMPAPRRANPWPWFFGGQIALTAVLLAMLLWRPPAQESLYRGLGPAASPAANALVMFRPDATEFQIRAALQSGGARLVDGPTATQAYLLRLPRADADALATLRRQPGVALAESLDARRP
jgi:anti-sigma factor RsiW